LQPVIFHKASLSAYEEAQASAADPYEDFFDRCYEAITRDSNHIDGFRDISDIIADREEPCFLDFMHIGEKANGVVAETIAKDLISVLETSTSRQTFDD
jgi:hypothetical protein